MGDDKVCAICLEWERKGFGPLGSRPLPGALHLGCRCDLEYT